MESESSVTKNLLSNKDLFKGIIENSREGIFISQNGQIKYANNAFCELVGYNQDELLHFNILNLLPVSETENINLPTENFFISAQADGIDCVILIHKNGEEIIVEFSSSDVFLEGENAQILSVRNITDRKKIQEKLEQSEFKYRNLVENAYDGIVINQFGKFKYVNPAFCNMLEYTKEELVEQNFVNFLADDDKERLMSYHKRRMLGETGNLVYEAKGVSKSGKFIHFEINSAYIEYEGNPATFIILRNHTDQKILENNLKASEQKYRTLIEKSLDGIVIVQNAKLVMVNQAFANMLGYSIEECLEKFGMDNILPEDKNWVKSYNRETINGNLSEQIYSIRLIGKNGNEVITEFTSTNIEIDGEPAELITSRDITSRITMQQALEKSERKFRELSDLLPQIVYELDSKGFVTYVNNTGREIFGYEEGMSDFHASQGVIPEDRERMKLNITKAIHGNNLSLFNEYTALRKDGSTFPVLIYAAPMIENNVFVGLRGLIVDISDRKRMEENLRKSEEHNRNVIQSLQEGLFVIQNEKIIFINEAAGKILGYTVDEMIGMNYLDIIPDEIKPNIRELPEYISENESYSVSEETVLLHKDGRTLVPVILSSTITEFDGIPAIVGTAKDITLQKKAEEEIKLAHKRLEDINRDLEKTILERTKELTKANTQLLKLQKENLQSQFDVLKQQVNPHFLFNSLNVLTSLIRLEPELAEKFTEHLAKVYRYVLENKDNELVTLNTELNFLDAYLFLINIRFMDKVLVRINIPESRKSDKLIPLAMQLLIENAIKHNSMSKKSPLEIDIFIDEINQLNVVNNLQEREAHMCSTGVGLKNIQNRYRLINNSLPVFEKTETQFSAKIPLISD